MDLGVRICCGLGPGVAFRMLAIEELLCTEKAGVPEDDALLLLVSDVDNAPVEKAPSLATAPWKKLRLLEYNSASGWLLLIA